MLFRWFRRQPPIRFALYAHAYEMRLGESSQITQTDFFCVDGKAHIERAVTRRHGAVSAEETWSDPRPCDRSCKNWFERKLDLPEPKLQMLKKLLTP